MPTCDPVAELSKLQESSYAFQLLQGMGLLVPGSLPPRGLTLHLPSNEAVLRLADLMPAQEKDVTIEDVVANWGELPQRTKEQAISVMLYHVVLGTEPQPDKYDAPTMLTAIYPDRYKLTILEGDEQVRTGTLQTVKRSADPYLACDNVVYTVDELLLPTLPLRLPATPLDAAEAVFLEIETAAQG
jgi:hypothetical protein